MFYSNCEVMRRSYPNVHTCYTQNLMSLICEFQI